MTPDPTSTTIVFTCDDLPYLPVEVYGWDNANNPFSVQPDGSIGGPLYDYCTVGVYVVDGMGECPASPSLQGVGGNSTPPGIEKKMVAEWNQPGPTTGFQLYQNSPNPFGNETLIRFQLPMEMETTFTLFDLSGKVLKKIRSVFPEGYNELTVNRQDLPSSGVFFYNLKTTEYSATRKIIHLD